MKSDLHRRLTLLAPTISTVGRAILGRYGNVVVGVLESKDIVSEARRIHGTSPTATALLGRLLTGAALYSLVYRGTRPKLITFEMIMDGPAEHAVAQVKGTRVRGYVKNPEAHAKPVGGKLAVSSIVGKGVLRVIRDGYVSEVPIVSGEVGEDIAHFFYQSEQRRTAVGVGVLVGEYGEVLSAGGFILEVLPDATEEEIAEAEERIRGLSVSGFLKEKSVEDLFSHLTGGKGEVAEVLDYRYECWCSYEEVKRLVVMMREELTEEEKREGKVVARCMFCKREYLIELD